MCPPARTSFPAARLSRASREPFGDGGPRSAADVLIDSHWISFLGARKAGRQPVQPWKARDSRNPWAGFSIPWQGGQRDRGESGWDGGNQSTGWSQGDSGPAGLASLQPAPLAGVGRDRGWLEVLGPQRCLKTEEVGWGEELSQTRGGGRERGGPGRPSRAVSPLAHGRALPQGLGALPLAPLAGCECTKAPEPNSLGNFACVWSLHVTTAQAGVEAANAGLILLNQLSPDSEAT